MKRTLAPLLAVAVIAAAVWWFVAGRDRPELAVARTLSAGATVAVVATERLDALPAQWDAWSRALPAELRAVAADAALRREFLGFEPSDPAGWAAVGLDPARGAGLVWDVRMVPTVEMEPGFPGRPLPVALVPITDPEKAFGLVERLLGARPTLLPGSEGGVGDRIQVLTYGAHRGLWATRDGLACVVLPSARVSGLLDADPAAMGALLRGWLDAPVPDPLAEDEDWKRAFRDAPEGPVSWFYAPAAGGLSLVKRAEADAGIVTTLEFYAARFPGVSIAVGIDGEAGAGRVRVHTSPAGLAALRQMFQPKKRPPAFARHLPAQGWWATRLSVNLRSGFDGLYAMVPPTAPSEVSQALPMGRFAVAMATGVAWEELVSSFSGHVAQAVDPTTLPEISAGATPDWVLLVGVQQASRADAVLPRILKRVERLKGTVEETPLDGRPAWTVRVGALSAVVTRVDDVVIAAPSADAVRRAAKRTEPESLASTPLSEHIDGDVVAGFSADMSLALQAIVDELDAAPPSDADPAALPFETALAAARAIAVSIKSGAPQIGADMRIDSEGLYIEGGVAPVALGLATLMLVGI